MIYPNLFDFAILLRAPLVTDLNCSRFELLQLFDKIEINKLWKCWLKLWFIMTQRWSWLEIQWCSLNESRAHFYNIPKSKCYFFVQLTSSLVEFSSSSKAVFFSNDTRSLSRTYRNKLHDMKHECSAVSLFVIFFFFFFYFFLLCSSHPHSLYIAAIS